MANTDSPKMIFRVPIELRTWLKATAEAERRTMTAQLLHILEEAKSAKQDRVKPHSKQRLNAL